MKHISGTAAYSAATSQLDELTTAQAAALLEPLRSPPVSRAKRFGANPSPPGIA